MSDIKDRIRDQALREGFDAVGFTSATADQRDREGWRAFVKKGWHGDMDWLARDDGRRRALSSARGGVAGGRQLRVEVQPVGGAGPISTLPRSR